MEEKKMDNKKWHIKIYGMILGYKGILRGGLPLW